MLLEVEADTLGERLIEVVIDKELVSDVETGMLAGVLVEFDADTVLEMLSGVDADTLVEELAEGEMKTVIDVKLDALGETPSDTEGDTREETL